MSLYSSQEDSLEELKISVLQLSFQQLILYTMINQTNEVCAIQKTSSASAGAGLCCADVRPAAQMSRVPPSERVGDPGAPALRDFMEEIYLQCGAPKIAKLVYNYNN